MTGESKAELYHDSKGLFRKGNPGGPGRPPKEKISDADALTLFRNAIHDAADPDQMAAQAVHNAFFKQNKNGSIGSVSWARLVLEYFIGPPTVRVRSEHVNVVEAMKLQLEQAVQAAQADFQVVDVAPDDKVAD